MTTRAANRKFHYIYKVTRFDGKYYIGLHSTDNLNDGYFGSGVYLWRSITRHGKDKHSIEIIEFCDSRDLVKSREAELVNEVTLKDPLCMNHIKGGGGGDFSESTCQKISAAKKGVKLSEETKMKMSESRKGQPKSEAHCKAIAASHMGKVGKPHTKESRLKISASGMGRVTSEETKNKQSETQKGRPKPILVCPHCSKSGGNSNMVRYHFDNCRKKS